MNLPSSKQIRSAEDLLSSPWGKAAANVKNPKMIVQQAESIARKYPKSQMAQRVLEASALVKKGGLKGESFDPRAAIIMLAALLYVVCPLDVIPDMIPVVGWLDDIGVLGIALYYAGAMVKGLWPGKSEGAQTSPQEEKTREELLDQVVLQVGASGRGYVPQTNLQDELTSLQQEAEELDDEVLMEQCQSLQEVALDPIRRVIVTGTFNAGKTSLINRLLGEPCLPVGVLPTTQVLTTLLHGERFLAVANLTDGGMESTEDAGLIREAHSAFYKDVGEVLIYHPAEILGNGFSIVDTPGLRDKKYALDFDSLPRSDSFVYVKSLAVADFSADELMFLAEASGRVSAEQMLLVLSKADMIGSEAELDAVEREMRLTLMKYGLGGIPVFRVTDRGSGDMLPQLREELKKRAESSMENQHEARVQQAAAAMREAVAHTRRRRAELEQMSADQRAAHQAKLAVQISRACEKIESRVESRKDLARQELHDYLFASLYPAVCHSIDKSTVNEKYVGQLTVQIRNELGKYLESKCRELASELGGAVGEEDVIDCHTVSGSSELPTPDSMIGGMAGYAKYVLPGIALATFFPMGIMAWLTTIAVPTFLLDKVGAGEGLGSLLRNVGQSGIRARLKEAVQDFLKELECHAWSRLCDFLDKTSRQVCQAYAKQIEIKN